MGEKFFLRGERMFWVQAFEVKLTQKQTLQLKMTYLRQQLTSLVSLRYFLTLFPGILSAQMPGRMDFFQLLNLPKHLFIFLMSSQTVICVPIFSHFHRTPRGLFCQFCTLYVFPGVQSMPQWRNIAFFTS